MNRFLQIHALTPYAPSNLNRDEMGKPKSALFGGVKRLRISSQCLKRTWRTSDVFQNELRGNIGIRTKHIGDEIFTKLMLSGNVTEDRAKEISIEVSEKLGKLEKDKMTLSQLVHISPKEQRLIEAIITNESEGAVPYSLAVLDKQVSGVDIALFGRMLADSPGYNVEAAVQVAHAITTHKVAPEVDFFTAVDDLNKGLEESGSGHLGELEFGSGLFYHYVCINKIQLLEHLEGEIDLVNKAIQALIEAIVTVSPNGKQNSFAALSRAAYVLLEAGSQQPRSLALAFFNPVTSTNILQNSIAALTETRDSFDNIYGKGWEANSELNILTKSGSLKELKKFVTEV